MTGSTQFYISSQFVSIYLVSIFYNVLLVSQSHQINLFWTVLNILSGIILR